MENSKEAETTQSVTPVICASAPAIAIAVSFLFGFLPKSQKTHGDLFLPKMYNGKAKGLANRSPKQYTFENCIILHKETKNNTLLKTVLFTQGSQKQYTFENHIVLHKEALH